MLLAVKRKIALFSTPCSSCPSASFLRSRIYRGICLDLLRTKNYKLTFQACACTCFAAQCQTEPFSSVLLARWLLPGSSWPSYQPSIGVRLWQCPRPLPATSDRGPRNRLGFVWSNCSLPTWYISLAADESHLKIPFVQLKTNNFPPSCILSNVYMSSQAGSL